MPRPLSVRPLAALLAVACAPELEGADQVYEANYTLVTAADGQFSSVQYPAADAIVDDLLDKGATGCGYALVEDGAVYHVRGVGAWQLGSVAPIGSASKTLTALGLLRLMEEVPGLDPSDSVQEHLPGAPWDVTLDALLTHSTGLDSWADFGPGPDLAAYPGAHPMQEPRYAFAEYAPYETLSQPTGAIDPSAELPQGSYSNVGYAVLGAVIDEIVSAGGFGVDGYEQWIWREVARGGNLTNGSPTAALLHTWRASDIPGLIPGYIGGAPAASWDVTGDTEGWEGPPGGWSMTVGDFGRIVAAIQREDIVSDDAWLQPRSAVDVFGGGGREDYGWGVVIEGLSGDVEKYTHPGDNSAYGAQWTSYASPDGSSFGVAVMCNAQVGKGNTNSIINRLRLAHAHGDLVPEFGIGTLQPVGANAVSGRRYAIDASASRTDLPGLGALGSELATALTLSVSRSRSGLDLTLTGSDRSFRAVTWSNASFAADPIVRTAAIPSLDLPIHSGGALRIEQATLTGTAGARGETLADVAIGGRLDTRTLDPSAIGGRNACEEAERLGRPCSVCADGSRSCVPVTLLGWTGRSP